MGICVHILSGRSSVMDRVIYEIQNYSKEYLIGHGFKYSRYLSDLGDDIYTYKFPLITYNKMATIECEIAVSATTGMININVYNAGTKELYASYYNREYGNCEIIKLMDIKINKKLKGLGIKKT